MWRFLHLSCCTSGKIFCRMKKKVYFCKQKSDDNIEKKKNPIAGKAKFREIWQIR